MNTSQLRPISVVEPVGAAIEKTKCILFQPFDLAKWFIIGFCAFLATLGGGGGGNFGGFGDTGGVLQEFQYEFEEIKEAVAHLANREGYDVVFVDDSASELPVAATEAEMRRQIGARRMLYTSPRVDITDQLVNFMNQ